MKPRHHLMIAVAALLAALILFFWPRSAAAQPSALSSADCLPSTIPSITVTAVPPTYVLVNNLSTRILNTRATYASANHSIMGMTASRTHVEVSIDAPAVAASGSGRHCALPRIDVVIALEPVDVYVAREFSPMSCAYRAVLKHEMQHVKVYTDELQRIEGLVRAQLHQRYDRPLKGDDDDLALLQREINDWLGQFIRSEMAKVEILQAKLDSYEETDKLSHACLGEVASMMGSSF